MHDCSQVILVVDDDEDIRFALSQVLEDEGYGVATAADGQAALERLAVMEPPCLILLDIMMPRMDGWQFLKKRTENPLFVKIPVVLVSAFGPLACPAEVAESLPKPVNLDRLLMLVRRACGEATLVH